METLAKATDLVLDKTGTLTTGRPELQDIIHIREDYSREKVLSISMAMELGQKHPLAIAIIEAGQAESITPALLADECIGELGRGLRSGDLRLGSRQWLGLTDHQLSKEQQQAYQQSSLVYLSDKKGLIAIFALLDTPREGAQDFIHAAQQRGIKVYLFSCDDIRY